MEMNEILITIENNPEFYSKDTKHGLYYMQRDLEKTASKHEFGVFDKLLKIGGDVNLIRLRVVRWGSQNLHDKQVAFDYIDAKGWDSNLHEKAVKNM